MGEQRIIRRGDKEVVVFTTPCGVQAIVDTSIPKGALHCLVIKLTRKAYARKSGAVKRP